MPTLKNKHIVLTHVTRRIGIRKARAILRKKLAAQDMQRICFLMDFEGAKAAGQVDEIGPPPADTAE